MVEINLKMNYFEFGVLFASFKDDAWERMPRSLWLKLRIISLEAYIKHPSFKTSDAETLKSWREELQKLEESQNGKKSK